MKLDTSTASAAETYRLMVGLITPRPIGWVSTISPNGVFNLAPFSFFNGVGAHPPTLVFSSVNRRDGSRKDTVRNIEATGEFVVNVATYDLRDAVNGSSAELPYEESEFAHVGLTAVPSERVRAPRVGEARAHLECALHQIVTVGDGPQAAQLVIGRILFIDVRDDVLDPNGAVDARALDAIGRLGGNGYVRVSDLFDLARPTTKR